MSNQKQARRSTLTLAVLAVVACAIAAAGYLRADVQDDLGRRYLRNGSGAVLFDHAAHQAQAEACVSCHHELAGDAADCADCYAADGPGHAACEGVCAMRLRPRVAKHKMFTCTQCGQCIAACDNCHEIAGDDEAENCRSCHDDAVADIYHASCNACHLASSPAVFADEDGKADCRRCHLK